MQKLFNTSLGKLLKECSYLFLRKGPAFILVDLAKRGGELVLSELLALLHVLQHAFDYLSRLDPVQGAISVLIMRFPDFLYSLIEEDVKNLILWKFCFKWGLGIGW